MPYPMQEWRVSIIKSDGSSGKLMVSETRITSFSKSIISQILNLRLFCDIYFSFRRRGENNLHGITAYWTTNTLSNAGMEGFNNKVRWPIRQAYGFRDKDYFILKIYNLPNTKLESVL